MNEQNREDIVFNRLTRTLTVTDMRSAAQVRILQLTHRALAPLGYLGISRVHGAINAILRPQSDTMIVEGSWKFRYPSNDYYWNRLLDAGWHYEPEIDSVLRKFANLPFVFIDLGANFGFWSSRMAIGLYGQHNTVAVEASNHCLRILQRNIEGARWPVRVYHRAIDEVSARRLNLFGTRHAGLSIDESWYGASSTMANIVETISIDDLFANEGIDSVATPTIIKLDVEGVELRALKGAKNTIAGQSLWLIEDAEKRTVSQAVRHAVDDLGMTLHLIESDKIRRVESLDEVYELKRRQTAIQATGLNLIATSSNYWLETIRGSSAESEGVG